MPPTLKDDFQGPRTQGSLAHGCLAACLPGSVAAWLLGSLAAWLPGSWAAWPQGNASDSTVETEYSRAETVNVAQIATAAVNAVKQRGNVMEASLFGSVFWLLLANGLALVSSVRLEDGCCHQDARIARRRGKLRR